MRKKTRGIDEQEKKKQKQKKRESNVRYRRSEDTIMSAVVGTVQWSPVANVTNVPWIRAENGVWLSEVANLQIRK
jgi:hypothetical protein